MHLRRLFFRTNPLLVFFFLPAILWAQQDKELKLNSFVSLKKSFGSPSSHYGSAPLWVWNTEIDSASISRMLAEFKENAFGGVFVHPRAGLITPYLSKKWLDLYRFTVQESKKNGLDVWIYDENSYPSGFAGGMVPEQMPSSYNQGEMLEYKKTDTLPVNTDAYYLCLKKEGEEYRDITANTSKELNQSGEYFLFRKTVYYQSPWYGGFSYVDLMAKQVTEKFIELTMNPYEESIGNEFGKTVRGIFSDEPNIEVQYPNSIRWTPDLFSRFKEKWGYDLTLQLPSLIEKTGDWKKVRHNYYQILLQLFIDRWSKPYSAYAAEKKLEWTGHYWEHEWPSPNHGPDNMAMYAWPQRPGIDMLFNQFNEQDVNAQFGNVRSVKELASVANQLNKNRTLSETYGGAGWELSFNDMKRLGDWEYVLGVNMLNQHLSFMSVAGARKYDYPQSFSYHEPWWKYYQYINRYFSRLSLSLSSGEQRNEILILEPTTTAWMYFSYDKPDTVFKILGNQFQQFITKLEHAQCEYDLGSENIIRDHGKTERGDFIIGSRSYKTVVIPPGMENIDMPSFVLLKKYVRSGGRLIQFSRLLTIDGSPNTELNEFYKNPGLNFIQKDSLDARLISTYFLDPKFKITRSGSSGDLYHYRRKLNDGEIVFFSNASLKEPVKADLQTNGQGILLLDLFTGQIVQYPVRLKKNQLTASFEIPPAGSVLFFISPAKISGYPAYKDPMLTGKKLEALLVVHRPENNSLSIDFCDLQIGDTIIRDMHVFDAADKAYRHHGFSDGNPWNTSVQFRDQTIRKNHFPDSSGFMASYYFQIAEEMDWSSFKAVVENPQLYQVSINGQEITPSPNRWWIDRDFKVFEIGKFVHLGKNSLTIRAHPMSIFAEIEPVYILGNFNLRNSQRGWDIIKPEDLNTGSWKKQGLPMYGQEIAYSKEITISKKGNQTFQVQLSKWKGTVASVWINEKFAGVIGFSPYVLNITSFLKNGKNTVRVDVCGSLKNVFGPFHRKPEPGMVSPWHWRYVEKYPPGDEYDTYDYGLMEDFEIQVSDKIPTEK